MHKRFKNLTEISVQFFDHGSGRTTIFWGWWGTIIFLYLFWTILHICPWLTFESNNLAGRVHDCGICRNRPPDWIGGVVHINDHDLSRISYFLSHADELVRLHGERGKADVCSIDANILELKWGKEDLKPRLLLIVTSGWTELSAQNEQWKAPYHRVYVWLVREIRTLWHLRGS